MWLPTQSPSPGDSQSWEWDPPSPGWELVHVVTGAVPQDRKIAHCPFHTLMPAERETFMARKRLLDYMGFQLRSAVMAKESQWDPKVLYLSKRGGWLWVQPRPCFS